MREILRFCIESDLEYLTYPLPVSPLARLNLIEQGSASKGKAMSGRATIGMPAQVQNVGASTGGTKFIEVPDV